MITLCRRVSVISALLCNRWGGEVGRDCTVSVASANGFSAGRSAARDRARGTHAFRARPDLRSFASAEGDGFAQGSAQVRSMRTPL